MNPEIMSQLENMSEEELNALLEAELPEELEKQAHAEVVEAELAEALYAYGALSAERAIAEIEGEGDLSKVASAEDIAAHEEAEANVAALIEQAIQELGLAESEDEVELHKTAQACAAVIFEGYSDALEKIAAKGIAAKGEAAKGMAGKLKQLGAAAKKKISEHAASAKKHVKKHSGKYGLGAGIGAGFGATKAMDKKASEMTVGEIMETINGVAEIENGLSKLAAKGEAKGEGLVKKMKDAYRVSKAHVKKHSGKYGLGAGLALGAGAAMASKKKD